MAKMIVTYVTRCSECPFFYSVEMFMECEKKARLFNEKERQTFTTKVLDDCPLEDLPKIKETLF